MKFEFSKVRLNLLKQYNSTKRNTVHTSLLACKLSLHIFLESNYKLVPWFKKIEIKSIQLIICLWVIHNFNTIKCNVAVNTVFQSVIRIASSKLYLLISYLLEDEFSFISACWINIIILTCTRRISAEYRHFLSSASLAIGSYIIY